jgi:hypothetical protein
MFSEPVPTIEEISWRAEQLARIEVMRKQLHAQHCAAPNASTEALNNSVLEIRPVDDRRPGELAPPIWMSRAEARAKFKGLRELIDRPVPVGSVRVLLFRPGGNIRALCMNLTRASMDARTFVYDIP